MYYGRAVLRLRCAGQIDLSSTGSRQSNTDVRNLSDDCSAPIPVGASTLPRLNEGCSALPRHAAVLVLRSPGNHRNVSYKPTSRPSALWAMLSLRGQPETTAMQTIQAVRVRHCFESVVNSQYCCLALRADYLHSGAPPGATRRGRREFPELRFSPASAQSALISRLRASNQLDNRR